MVKQVHMTSFFKLGKWEEKQGFEPFSVAVYQPKGFKLPKIDWTDIRRDGKWIRPSYDSDQSEDMYLHE